MTEADGQPTPRRPARRARDRGMLAVVGIGAAASNLDSLARFLERLPADSNMAFVVVVQKNDGRSDAHLLGTIRENTAIEVVLAQDKMDLAPNRIHVAPFDSLLTLRNGRLRLRSTDDPPGERGRMDTFLVSLALDQKEDAVGVILGGNGSGGTLGVAALKEHGGLAIAEDEHHNSHNSHNSKPRPDSPPLANALGLVDFVLKAEDMPRRMILYARHLAQLDERQGMRPDAATILGRIATLLRNATGHDFHGYKQNTFLRRVQRRMQVRQIESTEEYVETLRDDPDEVNNLFQDLLIGVTQFFRDTKEFEFLEHDIIPRMFDGRRASEQLRIWVLGCATGEEAYSIAILLREHMAKLDVNPHVQIFATDIDARSLAVARVGRYAEAAVREISPERLARWFVREGNTYCVAKELREMCIFSSHNLIKDAPFSRIDLISCRNLLIYLNSDLQNRVVPLFHFALRQEGFLFLGPSENVTRHTKLFSVVDRRFRIFRRQESVTRVLPEFPLSAVDRQFAIDREPPSRPRLIEVGLGKRAERIVERYAPAYVVVDEHHEVLHFSGRTGRYLDPSSGAASLNLLALVHRDLRLDLRAALHRAVSQRQTVRAERLQMGINGHRRLVDITVELIPGHQDEPLSLVVLFHDGEIISTDADDRDPTNAAHLRDEHIQRLDAELRLTRERLQATIEELESTNEELKSSNEEYQSINEELQSANEELETSKEELQSVNEELQTVNGELAHRVGDLARANSDLKNLLESTQIATVFLDNELRIKNFTPAIADVFRVVDSDVGRPITHIMARIRYPDLEQDVRKVLRSLSTIEREVDDPASGARYLARVLPYRSIDNFIAGTVVTFLDITAATKAERAMRASEEKFRVMAQTVPAILFTCGPDLAWDYANPRFYEYTGMPDGSALGDGWLAAIHPDDLQENHRRWLAATEHDTAFDMEFRVRPASGSYRWFVGRAHAVRDVEGGVTKWFGAVTDIHERRSSDDRQGLLLAELQHRVKNILAVVRSIAARTAENSGSVEEFASHFDGRLGALARTQNVSVRTVDGGIDLEELVHEELAAGGGHNGDMVRISGPPIRLGQKTAENLGLVLHELATNAVKYGAFAGHPGAGIQVSWRVHDTVTGSRLALQWLETGVPVMDTAPGRSGFGRILIEQGLPYELGATTVLEFNSGGVRCTIELPLSESVGMKRGSGAERRRRTDRKT